MANIFKINENLLPDFNSIDGKKKVNKYEPITTEEQNKKVEEFKKKQKENAQSSTSQKKEATKPEGEVRYNLNKEKVELKPYIYKDEKGKEKVDIGLFSEYLINKYPAIYVGSWMYFYQDGFYQKGRFEEEKTIIKNELGINFLSRHLIESAVYLWKIDDRVNKYEEDLNPDPYIINVKNGLLNMRTMELKPHTPEYISTIQVNANYNPEAKNTYFEKFLNEAVPDKAVQQVLKEIVGYSLTFFYKNKKRIFLLYGQKNTGKSTFLNVTLEALLPKVSKLHRQLEDFASDKYAGADLLGKTVNIYGDLSSKGLKETGTIKNLTGSDGLSAQHKFGHTFDFVNKAKFVFGTNKLPQNSSSDTSDAFYERVMILPFENQKKKDELDRNLESNIIENDLDYILLWAIEGLKKFIDTDFNFSDSDEIQRRVQNYEKENNSVLQFIDDCCVVGEEEYITPKDLMVLYDTYCEKELEIEPKLRKNVIAILKAKFGVKDRNDGDIRIPKTKVSAIKGIGVDYEKINQFDFLIHLQLKDYVRYKALNK